MKIEGIVHDEHCERTRITGGTIGTHPCRKRRERMMGWRTEDGAQSEQRNIIEIDILPEHAHAVFRPETDKLPKPAEDFEYTIEDIWQGVVVDTVVTDSEIEALDAVKAGLNGMYSVKVTRKGC